EMPPRSRAGTPSRAYRRSFMTNAPTRTGGRDGTNRWPTGMPGQTQCRERHGHAATRKGDPSSVEVTTDHGLWFDLSVLRSGTEARAFGRQCDCVEDVHVPKNPARTREIIADAFRSALTRVCCSYTRRPS